MILLALESSTNYGGIALYKDQLCLGHEYAIKPKSHSENINSYILRILEKNNLSLRDIDAIACGVGPGSFTGTRVSINIAKTLNYLTHKPIFILNTLENIAYGNSDSEIPYLVIINAFKNMVYYSKIKKQNGKLLIIENANVISVKDIKTLFDQKYILLGDGYAAYKTYFDKHLSQFFLRSESLCDSPSATFLAEYILFQSNQGPDFSWNTLLPLYLRASEAEENKNGIMFKPLE